MWGFPMSVGLQTGACNTLKRCTRVTQRRLARSFDARALEIMLIRIRRFAHHVAGRSSMRFSETGSLCQGQKRPCLNVFPYVLSIERRRAADLSVLGVVALCTL